MKRSPSSSSPISSSCKRAKRPPSEGMVWFSELTLQCARSGCVPCMYKLAPEGFPGSPPNQRPENCRRHGRRTLAAPLPEKSRLLTVGDGDFSFSFGLASSGQFRVVATSYESEDTMPTTYPNAQKFITGLRGLPRAKVFFEVDATRLDCSLDERFRGYFDVILWNFPCVSHERGADGQVDQLKDNQKLLRDFFLSLKPYLRNDLSRVFITHKTIEPFCWWGVEGIGKDCGYSLAATVQFDICCFPQYSNRKALDKKSFPANDAKVNI